MYIPRYNVAVEEFRTAVTSTEENPTCISAKEDRGLAHEEFMELERVIQAVLAHPGLDESGREEVRKRIRHRVRELRNAIEGMEERAREHNR